MQSTGWTISDLLELSGGYWSACALHAGVKLDVFTPLADKAFTAGELASSRAIHPRGLAVLLNALVALGLLEKKGELYRATCFAARHLAKNSPEYLGYIIMHHHHLMKGWIQLDEAVRKGGSVRERSSHSNNEAERESFLMGMFNMAMLMAPQIVPKINLAGRRRLLDLGGGPGTYAIHFCLQNADLLATVFDLPSTSAFAKRTINLFGLAERVKFIGGDYYTDPITEKYDVVWLSHILHAEGPEVCALILSKAVAALDRGGLILVQEFILNDDKDGSLFPALFSLNMLQGTPSGRSYSQRELFSLLGDTGVIEIRRLPIELPNGAGVIVGMVSV